MRKTLLIGIYAAVALLVAGATVWLWLNMRTIEPSEALRAIPIDAALVVRVQGLESVKGQLLEGNQFWSGISGFKGVAAVDSLLRTADSLSQIYPSFARLLSDNPVYISIHAVGKGDLKPLLVTNISERVRISDILDMAAAITVGKSKITQRDFNNVPIYCIGKGEPSNGSELCIAFHRGVALLTPSLLVMESAIGQLDGSVSLLNDRGFEEIMRTAGTRVDANVFINHQRLPIVFNQQIHANHRSGFEMLNTLAGWTELDLTVRNEAVWLNGFSQANDSLNAFYQVFAGQRPVPIKAHDVLPAQTAAVFFLGLSNYDAYMQAYTKYLEGRGKLRAYERELARFGGELGVNPNQFYRSFFGSEVALAYIPFEDTDYENCWFVAVSTRGQSHSKAIILDAIQSYARQNRVPLSSFERTFRVDRDKSVEIYRMPVKGLHQTLFGNLFSDANDQYFTFIDSYVVFGSSVEGLSRLILANVHNKQLAVEQSYREFSENLAPQSNFTAYLNPGRLEPLFGRFLAPKVASGFTSQMATTRRVQGIAMQLSGGRAMVFNSIFTRYSLTTTDDPQTVWETRLDTTFSMKPQLVVNHNTQHREIFVQDDRNNIYLINDIGRILWKRPLPEPIIGEVHQVDLYRNGRLQLLFNTRSSLYVVDRNGNNVDGFPARLRSPATNPVAVFDYEGNHDYRFVLAGDDRRIYIYDRSGNVVTGWDFDRTERVVTKPIQHFRMQNRDYIVLADANRPYILNRRGEERVRPQRLFQQGASSTFAAEVGSGIPPRFITTDTLGVVRFLYLDGRVEDLPLRSMSPQHTFDYLDVTGNGTREFVFLDGNNLYVFNRRGDQLFNVKLPQGAAPGIIYFHFGARDRKLGILSHDRSQIYLINGDGTMYKGFPLRGSTPFSIGQFANTRTRFNLVVGSPAGFVLNYAVQ